jgi:hypothetical protein
MYTGMSNIMRLERGPGSSLDEALLAACLKALMVDQFLADLVVPVAVYEPIYANQEVRTALLATMPTLDDVNITLVQRGDQSRDGVMPGADGLAGDHGGIRASGGPIGGRGGVSAGGWGGSPASGSTPAPPPSKGKQARVVLDDNEVSSDEDEPLQK